MKIGRLQQAIKIPEDVTLTLTDRTVKVKGTLGENERQFPRSKIQMIRDGNTLMLNAYFPNKKEKAMLGTLTAHINNLITGVTYGFKYNLKIVYSHFPIRVTPENKKNRLRIENLYGGRKPLYAVILAGVKVKVEDEDVIVTGINKEDVGQTSANIQEITRQRGRRRKSPKTFQDGIYVYARSLIAEN